jgi:hypothetical protein
MEGVKNIDMVNGELIITISDKTKSESIEEMFLETSLFCTIIGENDGNISC